MVLLETVGKTFSMTIALIASLVIFLILHYGPGNLTSAKIFSTIYLLFNIRVSVIYFGTMGLAQIFELKVILDRFLEIYRIHTGRPPAD
jgi:hypothetical protein